jgi:DNA mismatch endonuclease (patch repair protein)
MNQTHSANRTGTVQVAESTRRSMVSNRSSDTKLEVRFRRALFGAGLKGYRKNARQLPGSPDVAYSASRIAVFVNGCFWHGCPYCKRNLTPKTNALYWATKIAQNKERDERNRVALEAMGYRVIVLWECELKPALIDDAVRFVRKAIEERGARGLNIQAR